VKIRTRYNAYGHVELYFTIKGIEVAIATDDPYVGIEVRLDGEEQEIEDD